MTRAAELGSRFSHYDLGNVYSEGGGLTKAKFHYEATAIWQDTKGQGARCNVGTMEAQYRNMERGFKHFGIAASTGEYIAMFSLQLPFEGGDVIDSTLTAYNNSCAEMRSEARDT